MGWTMKREPQEVVDKSVYLTLIFLAVIAALAAMVTGPFGYEEISIGASVCAGLICIALLAHTLHAPGRKKK